MKLKRNKWLVSLAVLSVIITAIEGSIYYWESYSTFNFFTLMMVIQNCFKAFLFTSAISIADVMKTLTAATPAFERFMAYAYSLSVFLAPACTLGVIVQVIEVLMRKTVGKSRRKGKESIAIFGWNKSVEELLGEQRHPEDYSIRIYHSDPISEEEHVKLIKQGIESEEVNLLKMKEEEIQKWFAKQKLKSNTQYLFLESDPFLNISLYMKLSDQAIEEINKGPLHCNVSCPNNGIRQIFEDCTEHQKNIRLFNVKENAISKMFTDTPLYEGIQKNTNDAVHLLIIGLGDFGEEVLRQAILLSTMNTDNPILIDVIDKDASVKKDEIQSFFRKCMIDHDIRDNEIQISEKYCDGSLTIRFFKADATKSGLLAILDEAAKDSPFTYVVLSLGATNTALSTLNQMVFYLEDESYNDTTPVQVYLPNKDGKTEKLFEKIKRNKNVKEIDLTAFSIQNILDTQSEIKSASYNNLYDQIAAKLQQHDMKNLTDLKPEVSAQTEWMENEIPHYNKESARWQQKHAPYKQRLLETLYKQTTNTEPTPQSLREFIEDLIEKDPGFKLENKEDNPLYTLLKTEHRRWNYYMLLRGWKVYPDYEGLKNKSRINESKQHKDLIRFDDLILKRREDSNDFLYDIVPYLLLSSDSLED